MSLRSRLILTLLCAYFLAASFLFLPRVGIQADEVMFAAAVYPLGETPMPVMLMPYLGASKSWLWWPVLKLCAPSVWSLRVPAVLLGLLTVLLTFLLLKRVVSEAAGLVAAALLATHPLYLLTSLFDWGPMVLQHLFLIAALLLFPRTKSGFGLVCGLALWDKTLFVWTLSAMLVSGALIYRDSALWRRAHVWLGGILLGSFPLIVYNAQNYFATFQERGFSLDGVTGKFHLIWQSLQGLGLTGIIFREQGAYETACLFGYLFLVCIPFARGRHAFFLLAICALAWSIMLITKEAGGSIHHTMLVWPLPAAFTAVVLARFRWGWLAVLPVVAFSLYSTYGYHARLIEQGPNTFWSDAVMELHRKIGDSPAVALDWGIVEPVSFLSSGRVKIQHPHQSIEPSTDLLYISRIEPGFPDWEKNLLSAAQVKDLRKHVLHRIPDRLRHAVFEIYTLAPAQP